ncbi:hypothetical protein [Rhizobium sp. CCGE 510]|uniref:hypothetical protein n=1 Tax=Rhizobium sp. CCGE 510 TaxID=1132836 RepID=UPI000561B810|nr:hypothetical protein [Rhizobium sp. CCGE 510]
MTLHALRLPGKIEPLPDRRELDRTLAVYGETGEVAMNDGHADILSVPLVAASAFGRDLGG